MDQTPVGRADRPLAAFHPKASDDPERRIDVTAPIAHIGQGPQNDIVVDDDTISTRHARLEYTDGGWRLTDLDSRNGTYVEGVRLAPGVPTPLTDAAAVAFGAVQLRFSSVQGANPDAARTETATRLEKPAAPRRARFRLPVWLLVMILLFVALLVFLFIWFGGDPATVPTADSPLTTMASANSSPRATDWPRMAA
jgi:hypothetical protein